MVNSDKQVVSFLAIFIITYVAVWIIGLRRQHLLNYISAVNILAALTIIFYWVQHEMSIVQHSIEPLEIVVICLESLVIGVAVFSMLSTGKSLWIKLLQYSSFGIHLISLVAFLIFMLTFKITKLF